MKATKFRHWVTKDAMSDGVICNLEWEYEDGSTSVVSQHVTDARMKEDKKRHLTFTWKRLRKWRRKELIFAQTLTSDTIGDHLYWPVTVN